MSETDTFLNLYTKQRIEITAAQTERDDAIATKFMEKRKALKHKLDSFEEEQKRERISFTREYQVQQGVLEDLEKQESKLYPLPHCQCNNVQWLVNVLKFKIELIFPMNHEFVKWLRWKGEKEDEQKKDLEHLAQHGLTRESLVRMVKVDKAMGTFHLWGCGPNEEEVEFAAEEDVGPEINGHPYAKVFSTDAVEWQDYYNRKGEIELIMYKDSKYYSKTICVNVAIVTTC